jgi:hypothetical protein
VVAALALALALVPGCTAFEKLDRQTDDLLDEVNDSRPPSQGTTQAREHTGSTLEPDRRLRSDVHRVLDAQGDQVEVFGQTSSSSTTPGHGNTIEAKAWSMARTGAYRYITLQRSWRVATSLAGVSTSIPDLIGVRRDDRVDAFEVASQSDDREALELRLRRGLETLPPEHRGETDVILSDPSIRGGWFDD